MGFGIAGDVQDIGEAWGRNAAWSWGKGQMLEVRMYCGTAGEKSGGAGAVCGKLWVLRTPRLGGCHAAVPVRRLEQG